MWNLKNYIKRLLMNFAKNKIKFKKMKGPFLHPLAEKSPPAPVIYICSMFICTKQTTASLISPMNHLLWIYYSWQNKIFSIERIFLNLIDLESIFLHSNSNLIFLLFIKLLGLSPKCKQNFCRVFVSYQIIFLSRISQMKIWEINCLWNYSCCFV